MLRKDLDLYNLPDSPGVYFFKKGEEILYVGKATSLSGRVRSYFSKDLALARSLYIVKMVSEANSIEYKTCDSVLEALILEAHTIKDKQPIYNTREKDDKSYNYVVITNEPFPRVLMVRGRDLFLEKIKKNGEYKIKTYFGPFPHGAQLREALKIVRKIFPFRDLCIPLEETTKTKSKPCFNRQIGLCPGVCNGDISREEYRKTIRNIELFFNARKKDLEKTLTGEMKQYAKKREFEKAEKIKNQLFALQHIRDVTLLKKDTLSDPIGRSEKYRIEAYDIAHISGVDTVGVMVAVVDGEVDKGEYRKFKIRGMGGKVSVNDPGNLREILQRRMGHIGWTLPNLIVVDGSVAQINVAKEVLKKNGFSIEVAAVVKDNRHKAREIIGKKSIVDKRGNEILLANSEAHRFAQSYHRNLRRRPYRKGI
jgi:excinuclease ABC subunit C